MTITATNGSVTKSPDKANYNDGETVTLEAVPDTGYNFVNWSGHLSGSSNPATITMDADKSVTANFAAVTYTITASAGSGGSIDPSGAVTVASESDQSFTIAADTGYSIADVVVDGSSVGAVSSHTFSNVTANHSISASFAINTYSLTTSATNGSITVSPVQAGYDHGTSVTLQAVADTGYTFTSWSGDLSGSTNPATIVMDSDKSVTAGFAIGQYVLTISSTSGGSVSSPGEGSFEYDNGTDVSIQATAADNYYFINWTGTAVTAGKVANPNAAGTTVAVDASYTVRANFGQQDGVAPTLANLAPASGSIQAPLDSLIVLHVTDAGIGVDADSVEITLDGAVIYTGDTSAYNSTGGICRRSGTAADYTYAYQADELFDFDQLKTVTVNAADIGGVVMDQQSYSFRTEMRSFGENKQVSVALDSVANEAASTACDSSGNIWAVWHAGAAGSRDIYLGKLAAGADSFGASVRLTTNGADQVNPALALGPDDKLYVVWQDNRRGNWDVFGSTSINGTTWSTEQRIADLDDNDSYNQTNPAIVVDSNSPNNNAHVVWQDDRAGNQDIYIARSSTGFVTKDISPITSDTSHQTGPAIAVDSSNVVYVLWTDARNAATGADIYGASGPSWTNVAVVRKAADQSNPVIAAESAGSILHMLWTDRASGNSDIYYASSSGLPANPLAGSTLIDDALGAGQLSSTIAVTGTAGTLGVFACWQDGRNVSGDTGDLDIYMVQTNSGSGTNVFVGDGGTNSSQLDPAMGVDQSGYPYVVWTDNRSTNPAIYYAGSTCMESSPLVSGPIDASSGGSVGTADVQSITGVDDVSIVLPAGACPYDVTISITKVANPHDCTLPFLNGYEFSPSGLEFNSPVTITIPYAVSGAAGTPTPYWYNSLTGTLSQQEIDNIEIIEVSSSIHALRFTTTHLTPYYALLGAETSDDGAVPVSSDGGDGGCSLSNSHQGGILEYFLPYAALALFMCILRRRDRARKLDLEENSFHRSGI